MADEASKTLSVKLHADVVKAARIVSSYRDEAMTDMLSGILRPILARMEDEEVAKRGRASKGKGKAKGGEA